MAQETSKLDHNLDIAVLMTRLGHDFADPSLLIQALTHSSTVLSGNSHFERLEFLGDRVLGLVVAHILLEEFATDQEGALARRHVALVRREALAEVAVDMGLGEFIHLSKGEVAGGGRVNPGILSDALEAVLAALYLDGGLDVAADFIKSRWTKAMLGAQTPPMDAKTRLQEWAQGSGKSLPRYQVVDRQGPDHEPHFTIQVSVVGQTPQRASGASKRAAEQAAASALLEAISGKIDE